MSFVAKFFIFSLVLLGVNSEAATPPPITCKVLSFGGYSMGSEAGTMVSCGERIGYVDTHNVAKYIPGFKKESVGATFTIAKYADLPIYASNREHEERLIDKPNCMYVIQDGDQETMFNPIKIDKAPECSKHKSFENTYGASIQCGSQPAKYYFCPIRETKVDGPWLEADSCVSANTKAPLRKTYFGDGAKGGTSDTTWSSQSSTSSTGFKPQETPRLFSNQGNSLCFGRANSEKSKATVVGPASSDGKCDLDTLYNDKCFSMSDVKHDEQMRWSKFAQLPEEVNGGSQTPVDSKVIPGK